MAGTITGSKVQHRSRGLLRLKAAFTTDASGDVSLTKIGAAFGKVVGVIYDAGDLDTGTDITLSDGDTGATIFALTNAGVSDRFIRPTQVVTDNAGVAVTAAVTAVDVNRDIYVAGQLKLLVAQGGNAKSGSLTLLIDERA